MGDISQSSSEQGMDLQDCTAVDSPIARTSTPHSAVNVVIQLGKLQDDEAVGAPFHSGASCSAYYDIYCQNLSYKISVRKGRRVEKKMILNNVTAMANHGELLAIFGESGSSKTTLLDCVAGRVNPKSLSGSILINGSPVDRSFRRICGYVMQNDNLFAPLTVRETLMYSARLRLPNTMTSMEKRQRVEWMIEQLGLKSCADTHVGGAQVRGISGGEKRRLSIGVDVIHDPTVLFLDEPTSGLDSNAALQVMKHLSNLAVNRSRTVVVTLHQPSPAILDTIHNCLVLAHGNVVYSGTTSRMKSYFNEIGYSVELSSAHQANVVEFVLATVKSVEASPTGLQPLLEKREEAIGENDREIRKRSFASGNAPRVVAEYALPMLQEMYVLAGRNTTMTLRTKPVFYTRLITLIIGAVVAGSFFFRAKLDTEGLRKRQSFVAFSVSFITFSQGTALPVFIQQRGVFIRESSTGAYRKLSYLLVQSFVMLPFLWILSTTFSMISFLLVGYSTNLENVFIFLLTYFLVLANADAYFAMMAAWVPDHIIGRTVSQAYNNVAFLVAGFYISRNAIPVFWLWMHYISHLKYPYEALLSSEMSHLDQHQWPNVTSWDTAVGGLGMMDIVHVNSWSRVAYTFLCGVVFRLLFFIALIYRTTGVRK